MFSCHLSLCTCVMCVCLSSDKFSLTRYTHTYSLGGETRLSIFSHSVRDVHFSLWSIFLFLSLIYLISTLTFFILSHYLSFLSPHIPSLSSVLSIFVPLFVSNLSPIFVSCSWCVYVWIRGMCISSSESVSKWCCGVDTHTHCKHKKTTQSERVCIHTKMSKRLRPHWHFFSI